MELSGSGISDIFQKRIICHISLSQAGQLRAVKLCSYHDIHPIFVEKKMYLIFCSIGWILPKEFISLRYGGNKHKVLETKLLIALDLQEKMDEK